MKNLSAFTIVCLALYAAFPGQAFAHALPGQASGFVHPFAGVDHLLAMLAVGLWAQQRGGRSLYLIPLSFVVVMTIGFALGMSGIALQGVELWIALSVLLLGVFIAVAARFPTAISMVLVGGFALFHGHAHGTEMPMGATALAYGGGFLAATIILHALGIGIGGWMGHLQRARVIRFAGAGIAIMALALIFV